jgi:hypothetical protein
MNPIALALLKRLIPFAIAAAFGFGVAWTIQGLRITAAHQEFTDFKQEQTRLIQEARDAADNQREQASKAFAQASKELEDSIARGDAFRRCVAAGKCGRVPDVPRCPEPSVPPAVRPDETGAEPVPAPGDTAAPGVVADCAYTTLRLNKLQADIENQPGYQVTE